jgi:hypothetical protein
MPGRNWLLSLIGLLAIAFGTIGGSCVVVETGPPGAWNGPGENEEAMRDQEEEILEESDR